MYPVQGIYERIVWSGCAVFFKIKGQTFCGAWFILSRRRPGRINNLRMQSSPGPHSHYFVNLPTPKHSHTCCVFVCVYNIRIYTIIYIQPYHTLLYPFIYFYFFHFFSFPPVPLIRSESRANTSSDT